MLCVETKRIKGTHRYRVSMFGVRADLRIGGRGLSAKSTDYFWARERRMMSSTGALGPAFSAAARAMVRASACL